MNLAAIAVFCIGLFLQDGTCLFEAKVTHVEKIEGLPDCWYAWKLNGEKIQLCGNVIIKTNCE